MDTDNKELNEPQIYNTPLFVLAKYLLLGKKEYYLSNTSVHTYSIEINVLLLEGGKRREMFFRM